MPLTTVDIHEFTFPSISSNDTNASQNTDLASFPIPAVDALFSTIDGEWSGWTYDRPRTTWIENRLLPHGIADVDPYIASHLLLLTHRQTTDPAESKGIVAVYPVGSTSVHATLSAGRKEQDEPSNGLYIRLRKIVASEPAAGGKACVVVVRADSEREVHRVVARAVEEARVWLRGVEEGHKVEREELRPFKGLEETSPLQGLGFCTWSSIGEGTSSSSISSPPINRSSHSTCHVRLRRKTNNSKPHSTPHVPLGRSHPYSLVHARRRMALHAALHRFG